MTIAEQYLIDYLNEEFRRHPEVRIRVWREDHEEGVSVKTAAREYFFPFEWTERGHFKKIQEQVRQIQEIL